VGGVGDGGVGGVTALVLGVPGVLLPVKVVIAAPMDHRMTVGSTPNS
jgi:hypothetical protein